MPRSRGRVLEDALAPDAGLRVLADGRDGVVLGRASRSGGHERVDVAAREDDDAALREVRRDDRRHDDVLGPGEVGTAARAELAAGEEQHVPGLRQPRDLRRIEEVAGDGLDAVLGQPLGEPGLREARHRHHAPRERPPRRRRGARGGRARVPSCRRRPARSRRPRASARTRRRPRTGARAAPRARPRRRSRSGHDARGGLMAGPGRMETNAAWLPLPFGGAGTTPPSRLARRSLVSLCGRLSRVRSPPGSRWRPIRGWPSSRCRARRRSPRSPPGRSRRRRTGRTAGG